MQRDGGYTIQFNLYQKDDHRGIVEWWAKQRAKYPGTLAF